MTSRLSIGRLTATAPSRLLSPSAASPLVASVTARCCTQRRTYSSEEDAPPPPLLAKLRGDLKTAMKAKDKNRLTVLRAIMAATLNASKTANPVNTNAKVVALLRKTAKSSQDAVAEFRQAGREDLAEQEENQIKILEEYADSGGVKIDPAEVEAVAKEVLAKLKEERGGATVKAGDVIKILVAPGGPLDGKDVDRAEMARTVKNLVA
ncbi:hypothetical protein SPBR_03258 [Sporothrix brasiliensis 5110]|uniref:Altered inheritance of mitochondria protein 41 n=1 Tax=Sporothrix brasiliensis 5110 TaxID=1398154 RepID=A0A0C2FMN9_9PEZI|nr:uncharacterized protein SPBR_03258 [Sporothrix brasiliensis 5110]KIH92338.1 hypothetical protein SPBR_03258 [Sporothrix brasiliensis 5110]